jgi:hypothetical protein
VDFEPDGGEHSEPTAWFKSTSRYFWRSHSRARSAATSERGIGALRRVASHAECVSDDALAETVAVVHDHLRATEQLPLSARANGLLGEATAVVADLHDRPADAATTRERLATARELLAELEATGHPEADDHVDRARAALAAALDDE